MLAHHTLRAVALPVGASPVSVLVATFTTDRYADSGATDAVEKDFEKPESVEHSDGTAENQD